MLLHRSRTAARQLVPRRLRPAATAGAFAVVAVALRGHNVSCSCCGGRFRRFLDYPTLYCPGCGAYERHRQLCLFLDRNVDLVAGADVLHVGPEKCIIDRFRPWSTSWLAVDLDHPRADRQMDVQQLDLPSCSFDTVLCAHVLDAVPDPARASTELYRVLRPNGTLLLHTPDRRDIPPVIAAGFEVETIVLDEQRNEPDRGRLGLDPLPLYRCTR